MKLSNLRPMLSHEELKASKAQIVLIELAILKNLVFHYFRATIKLWSLVCTNPHNPHFRNFCDTIRVDIRRTNSLHPLKYHDCQDRWQIQQELLSQFGQ